MKKLNILLVSVLLLGNIHLVSAEEITQKNDEQETVEMIQENTIDKNENKIEEETTTINDEMKGSKVTVDAEEDLAVGTFGTSPWRIDSTGVLHIGAGEFDAGQGPSTWYRLRNDIKQIIFEGPVKANKDSSGLFQYLENVTSIDHLPNLDISQATDISSMFGQMKKLRSLDLSNFNTENVVTMAQLFRLNNSLISLDVSRFDTSKVTDMTRMFEGISSLVNLDISNFDTSKVVSMNNMFMNVTGVKELNLSHFNTSQMTEMRALFYGMTNLESLDISNFDTTKVTAMVQNFDALPSLKHIKLSQNFQFKDTKWDLLPTPSNVLPYYGKWQRNAEDPAFTPLELAEQYDGFTMSGDYYWAEKKAKIEVKDSTIQLGDAWEAKDNFVSATDINGQPVAFSSITVDDRQVDKNKAGTYEVTYSYDGVTQIAKVTVEDQQKGQITLRYVDTFGQPIVNPITGSVFDPVTFSGNIGDSADDDIYWIDMPGWVMLHDGVPTDLKYETTSQSYDVVYEHSGVIYVNYQDDKGNKLAPEDRIEDYVHLFDWSSGALISSVHYKVAPKSIAGYEVASVEGDAEEGDVGPYEIKNVTFVYKKIGEATVHVKDSTIHVGDNWQAENNFVSATDNAGQNVAFKELTITGTVDTSKAGDYEIVYEYDGVAAKAIVTVKERQDENGNNNGNGNGSNSGNNSGNNNEEHSNQVTTTDKNNSSSLPQTGEQTASSFAMIGLFAIILSIVLFKTRKNASQS